jgi:hypothetical protein
MNVSNRSLHGLTLYIYSYAMGEQIRETRTENIEEQTPTDMAPLYLCQSPLPLPREILSNGSMRLSGPMTLLGFYRAPFMCQFTAAGYYEGKRQTVEVGGGGGSGYRGGHKQIKTT